MKEINGERWRGRTPMSQRVTGTAFATEEQAGVAALGVLFCVHITRMSSRLWIS